MGGLYSVMEGGEGKRSVIEGGGGVMCVVLLVSCEIFIFSSSLPPLSPHFFPFPQFFLFFYFVIFVFRRMMCTGE